MESYFQEQSLISLGVLIVDARHKPTADDETMCTWFKESGCPLIVVANKLDKLKRSEWSRICSVFGRRLSCLRRQF